MKVLKTFLFTLLLAILFVTPAQASGDCTNMYGQVTSNVCTQLTVDKKVLKPGTKDYVDNLSLLDPRYHPKDTVVFQIDVKNSGTNDMTNIDVTDYLPQNMSFVSGPGSYDAGNNKVTFTLASLKTGETQTFYISAKVAENISLGNAGAVCLVNSVHAEKKDRTSADDNAQFCVERVLQVAPPVLGIKQAPPTGPEAIAIPMLFGMGGLGWFLRKKTGN